MVGAVLCSKLRALLGLVLVDAIFGRFEGVFGHFWPFSVVLGWFWFWFWVCILDCILVQCRFGSGQRVQGGPDNNLGGSVFCGRASAA